MLLLYFLIVFFISLFIYQIILAFYPKIEGMETNNKSKDNSKDKSKDKNYGAMYEEYPTDPLILGKLNAGNIQYLKGQIDTISTNTTEINEMQTTIDQLQQQVSDLSTQMSQLSQSLISSEPPDTSSVAGYSEDTSYDTVNMDNTDNTNNTDVNS
jgi:uncharacterized coiled-coil protein SlyX